MPHHVHIQSVREALAAEVRSCEDWHIRQGNFGSPAWKLAQIDSEIDKAQTELDIYDDADGDPDVIATLRGEECLRHEHEQELEDLCDLECDLAEGCCDSDMSDHEDRSGNWEN